MRAGAGVFNDRSGPVVIADVLHSLPGGLTRIVLENPAYPEPLIPPVGQPQSVVLLAPDVQIPQTLQYGIGVDRQLRKSTTLSVTYTGARGYHLFRSRDVNAPLPPLYAARPDPAYGVIRQVESTGRQDSDSVQFSARGRMARWFDGQLQYTLSRVNNDTSGISAFPANDYDLSGEWSRADFDRRHRLIGLGRLTAIRWVDIGLGLTMNSGAPYSATLGADIYNNGRGHVRPPGVSRNSLETTGYSSLDVRLSKELKISGPNRRPGP